MKHTLKFIAKFTASVTCLSILFLSEIPVLAAASDLTTDSSSTTVRVADSTTVSNCGDVVFLREDVPESTAEQDATYDSSANSCASSVLMPADAASSGEN